jgi:hypothetical protein
VWALKFLNVPYCLEARGLPPTDVRARQYAARAPNEIFNAPDGSPGVELAARRHAQRRSGLI